MAEKLVSYNDGKQTIKNLVRSTKAVKNTRNREMFPNWNKDNPSGT